MIKKTAFLLCFVLVLSAVPTYALSSFDPVDDLTQLANHPESTELLALKGAGVDGVYQGMGWCPACGTDMPQSHFPHTSGTSTGASTPGGINVVGLMVAMAGVALIFGILYVGMYGTN